MKGKKEKAWVEINDLMHDLSKMAERNGIAIVASAFCKDKKEVTVSIFGEGESIAFALQGLIEEEGMSELFNFIVKHESSRN